MEGVPLDTLVWEILPSSYTQSSWRTSCDLTSFPGKEEN